MIGHILVHFNIVFTAVYNWFVTILDNSGAWAYVLGVALACLISRFLFVPVMRGRLTLGSDAARSTYNNSSAPVMDADYRRIH